MDESTLFHSTELSIEAFQELLPFFFEEIGKDFEDLELAFEKNQLKEVRQIAHKIKGSAASFSAAQIVKEAGIIQDRIDSKNEKNILNCIKELSLSIDRSHIYAIKEFDLDQ